MNYSNLNVQAVEDYVASIFNLYKIDRRNLAYYAGADEESDEIPVFPEGIIDEEILADIRKVVGFTEEELLSLDEDVKQKYWKQYPFFELENDFFTQRLFADSTPEDFLRRIFNQKPETRSLRYDLDDVERRMKQKLHEIDNVMPGTWHYGAEILDLHITTENMISFPQCREMMLSALQMVEDLKKLFFKALVQDLSGKERDQLNFLVHYLQVTDICLPSTLIDYDTIQAYKDVYRLENLSDFHSYVTIRGLGDYPVWESKEFLDDRTLAEKYMNLIPDGKKILREYAMAASKFNCDFVWSDADIEEHDEEEEAYFEEIGELKTKEDYLAIFGEHTEIWIEKEKEEMGEWEPYIQRLRVAASSANLGGFHVSYREHGPFGSILLSNGQTDDRHRLRVMAKGGKHNESE